METKRCWSSGVDEFGAARRFVQKAHPARGKVKRKDRAFARCAVDEQLVVGGAVVGALVGAFVGLPVGCAVTYVTCTGTLYCQ
jgi:hypothetical protein